MKIDEKQKKKKKKKERKKEKKEKLPERSWAHFILMKPWEEGVGVVEWKQIKSLQVEQKEKESEEKEMKNTPSCVNRLGTTTAGSSWLQQCTMLAVLTWPWPLLRFQLHFTMHSGATCTLFFFCSRYVRAVTLLSILQARKWSRSLRSLKHRSRPWFLRA